MKKTPYRHQIGTKKANFLEPTLVQFKKNLYLCSTFKLSAMTNTDFWKNMQNSLSQGGLYINDFHRSNSMAAQREVAIMSLHPYSREQVLTQVASLRRKAVSKESANAQRRRQNI